MFGFGKKEKVKKLKFKILSSNMLEDFQKKLLKEQSTSDLKGYRKGKAPLDVIENIYGEQLKARVIYELMTNEFYKIVTEKKISVVGQPALNPLSMDINKDINVEASYEVYPEFDLKKFSSLKIKKPECDLKEEDVNSTIEKMQRRFGKLESVQKEISDGDFAKINFEGFLDNEKFEGGEAKDYLIEIGSKNMIPGFEEGLIGLKAGDKKDLNLNFPDDYHAENLKGKETLFKIEVNEVLNTQPAELNEEFYIQAGIPSNSEKEFRDNLKTQLEKDLKITQKRKLKERIFDAIEEQNTLEIPSAMVLAEAQNLRNSSAQQMGMDPTKLKDEELPLNTFEENATKRVKLGVILNKIIEERKIEKNDEVIKELIEERASGFKDPEQYKQWIFGNEDQLKNIESIALEEQVTELISSEAKCETEKLSFEEIMAMS
ncbi:MAG: trigger factor [Gammaproteobacteria bacterium]